MRKVIYLNLFILLLVACSDNKYSRSNSKPLLSKGTVILVFVDKDSIVVAADSRSETISPNRKSQFSDTTNKITRVGNVFFTAAGTTTFKSKSVQAIILKNYNPSKPIAENCENINKLVARDFQNYFNSLSIEEKKYYSSDELSNTLITILATGYEKNKPIACSMTINTGLTKNKILVAAMPVKKDSMLVRLHVGGYYERIYDYPFAYMLPCKNRLKDMMELIKWESYAHPKEVNTKVNYAIVKKSGFRIGRNY